MKKKNLKRKQGKKIQLVQLMKNQKQLENLLSECLMESSRLKEKRSYGSTKCRRVDSTEDITLPTKIKGFYDQIKSIKQELKIRAK